MRNLQTIKLFSLVAIILSVSSVSQAKLTDQQLQLDAASIQADMAHRNKMDQQAFKLVKTCVPKYVSRKGEQVRVGDICTYNALGVKIADNFTDAQVKTLEATFKEIRSTRNYMLPVNSSTFSLSAADAVEFHKKGHHKAIEYLEPTAEKGWVAQHWTGRGLTQLGGAWVQSSHPTYMAAVLTHEAQHEWVVDHASNRFGASVVGALAAIKMSLNSKLAQPQRLALLDYAFNMVKGVRDANDRENLLDYVSRARAIVQNQNKVETPPVVNPPSTPPVVVTPPVVRPPVTQPPVVQPPQVNTSNGSHSFYSRIRKAFSSLFSNR